MTHGETAAEAPRWQRQRRFRSVLALAGLLVAVGSLLGPAGCTRTVCDDALDICGEPAVDALRCDDPSFVCTSQCIVDNDTCDEDLLESCLKACP